MCWDAVRLPTSLSSVIITNSFVFRSLAYCKLYVTLGAIFVALKIYEFTRLAQKTWSMMATSRHTTRTTRGDFTFRQRNGDGMGGDLRGTLIYPWTTKLLIFDPLCAHSNWFVFGAANG